MILAQLAGGLLTLAVLGFSSSSACSSDDIQACKAPLEVMAKSGITPLTQDCEAVENAMECIATLKKECNSEMLDISLINEEMYDLVEKRSRCEGEQLVRNKRGFLQDVVDVYNEAKDTAEDAADKVKVTAEYVADKVKDTVMKIFWKRTSKGRSALRIIGRKLFKSCTTMEITACGATLLAMPGRLINIPDKCSTLMQAFGCLEEAASRCSVKMAIAVMAARATLDTLDTGFCQQQEPADSNTDTSSVGSCTREKLQDCGEKLTKSDETKAICLSVGEAEQCLEDAKKDCKSHFMLSEIREYQVLLKDYIESCQSQNGNGNKTLQPTVISLLVSSVFIIARYIL